MKTRITLALACFIGFILYSAAVAYYPALIVRECPHCKAHMVQEDTLSGNTIGAKYYTDGKREAKMLLDHPALVKCPKCSKFFWVEDAPEVGVGFDAAKPPPAHWSAEKRSKYREEATQIHEALKDSCLFLADRLLEKISEYQAH